MVRILVVEDDTDINNMTAEFLRGKGCGVEQAFSGTEGRLLWQMKEFDLLLLDLMLPGLSGEELIRQIRENSRIPVIVLTAKNALEDKVEVLGGGADDYLTKPFHFQELEARIRSLTRRKFVQEDVCLKWNQLTFDTRTRETSVNGVPISLTRKESSLLEYFLLHQNRVISPEEMIEHIWDGSVNTFSNSIRVHISSLRKKLKAAIGFDPIQNKIGQGYILEEYR